jgi:hypothetical protein
MTATATISESDVLDHVASEVDSIRLGDSSTDVAFKPEAVNREGQVD